MRGSGQVRQVEHYRDGKEHGLTIWPGSPGGSVHQYVEGREVSNRRFKTKKQLRRWLRENPGVFPENGVSCDA